MKPEKFFEKDSVVVGEETEFSREFCEQLENFKLYLTVERGLSENTVLSYTFDLRDLEVYLRKLGLTSLKDLEPSHLHGYLAELYAGKKAKTTLARHLSSIRAFTKYLHKEKILPKDPAANLDSPKQSKLLPNVLTPEQVEQLLREPDCSTPTGQRDRAMLELMYATGLRVSELCNLPINDYNGYAGFVRVIGKGNKERIVPVGKTAVYYVDQYINHGRRVLLKSGHTAGHKVGVNPVKKRPDMLFLNAHGGVITRQGFWQKIKHYAKQAGFSENVKPHTLRHSVATHLLENGADIRIVQEILGHESVATTQIYTHLTNHHLRKVYEEFHPRAHLEEEDTES